MFRDLKEYQEIAKIYVDKVSKPENLEERRGSSVEQLKKNRETVLPATPPQKGAGGGVGNPTNVRGSGAGTAKPIVRGAQGRTRRPQPEIKKFPTTAEIRAANQGRVGGGNAGGSTDSGGTSQSTIKSVEQKPEVKTPDPKPSFKDKFIKKDKGVGFVKRGTAPAQRAENKEKAKLRAQEMAKARIAAKKEGTASTPMSGKEKAQAMAKARLAKKAAMEEYTPYDIVLEYLLSTEQVATIEEANYVMTEMDAETIQSIVEMDMMKMPVVNVLGGIGSAIAGTVAGARYLGRKAGERGIKKEGEKPGKPGLVKTIKDRTDATNKAIEKMNNP